jgi:predicted nuclease of predicted toxin-antitoxin system
MKFVIDMNISPSWVPVFEAHGMAAIHWSQMGSYSAPDAEILRWARDNDTIIFTNDLDFGAIIAATVAEFPSVIQLRDLDVTPDRNADILIDAINEHRDQLARGALISIDASRSRVHILPIRRD